MKPKIDLEGLRKTHAENRLANITNREDLKAIINTYDTIPNLITALEEARKIINEVDGYGYKGTKEWLAQFEESEKKKE